MEIDKRIYGGAGALTMVIAMNYVDLKRLDDKLDHLELKLERFIEHHDRQELKDILEEMDKKKNSKETCLND